MTGNDKSSRSDDGLCKPEELAKDDLDQIQGGYSVWIGGSVKRNDPAVDDTQSEGIHGMETGFGGERKR